MRKIQTQFRELLEIYKLHGLDSTELEEFGTQMKHANVCVPIIGKFSTGKSALCNALLGYSDPFLQEDITPETAVPTELIYGSAEQATVSMKDGTIHELKDSQHYQDHFDTGSIARVRIQLNNSFLETIPNVMLVDMPGFDSGYQIHNMAIDNYLPDGLAYLIAFAADDMTIKDNMGNFLRELNDHNMPIAIVITKRNKVADSILDENLNHLEQSLKKYIGNQGVTICLTESHSGRVEEVKAFLEEIQAQSQEILAKKFSNLLQPHVRLAQQYLSNIQEGIGLSQSELSEKEESLNRQMQDLSDKLLPLEQEFDRKATLCADQIIGDVSNALDGHTSAFVTALMSKRNIENQLNSLVRTAVNESYQRHFTPLAEGYLTTVCEKLDEIRVSAPITSNDSHKNTNATIGAAGVLASGVAGSMVAPTAISGLMASGALAIPGLTAAGATAIIPMIGPIIAGISVLLAGLVYFVSRGQKEEKKGELQEKLHTEIYPQILQQLRPSISDALTSQTAKIKQAVNQDIATQRKVLEKELADTRALQEEEAQARDDKLGVIATNLNQIGEMIYGI